MNKKLKILIGVTVGFVIIFLISIMSFYMILKPKIDNPVSNEVEESQTENITDN